MLLKNQNKKNTFGSVWLNILMRTYFLVLLFSEHGNNVALETTLTVKSKGLVLCSLYSHNISRYYFHPRVQMSSWS